MRKMLWFIIGVSVLAGTVAKAQSGDINVPYSHVSTASSGVVGIEYEGEYIADANGFPTKSALFQGKIWADRPGVVYIFWNDSVDVFFKSDGNYVPVPLEPFDYEGTLVAIFRNRQLVAIYKVQSARTVSGILREAKVGIDYSPPMGMWWGYGSPDVLIAEGVVSCPQPVINSCQPIAVLGKPLTTIQAGGQKFLVLGDALDAYTQKKFGTIYVPVAENFGYGEF